MNQQTKTFLERCDSCAHINPSKTSAVFSSFMKELRAAQLEAIDLRTEFVEVIGEETDSDIRGTIYEIDQKHGALEREINNLLSQAARVQDILRDCREGAKRIRESATTIAEAKTKE